jgi:RNA polymerase sigma-70 factor (ECF subfamily)
MSWGTAEEIDRRLPFIIQPAGSEMKINVDGLEHAAGEKMQAGASLLPLIQRCKDGDQNAFREIYRTFVPRVRGTLFRMVGEGALDDMTQEVFLKLWKSIGRLDNPENFATWVYRITVNTAYDLYRKRRQEKGWLSMFLDTDESMLPVTYPLVVEQRAVWEALSKLSLDHRTIVVLYEIEQLSLEEIAAIIDKPVGTVKSRLFHARGRLREILSNEEV